MRKINDTKELNEIYGQINGFIQQYIESHNILPSEIYKYVKKNMNRFLEKNNLKDIDRIDQIVEDVIRHRFGMEKDRVHKFENFITDPSLFESMSSTFDYEKVLADYYNTSVGHVEVIDMDNKIFKIKSIGDNGNEFIQNVIIYSQDDIETLKSQIQDNLVIKVTSTLGVDLNEFNLEYPIDSIGTLELGNILSEKKLMFIISKVLKSKIREKEMTIYRHTPIDYKGHLIWELTSSIIM